MIRHPRAPLAVLAVLVLATLALLAVEALRLPGSMATHFDGAGHPDAWVCLTSHVWWSALLGILFPLLPTALMAAALRLPARFIKVPNRNYWLDPERRAETRGWLIRHTLWLGCGLAALHLILQAMVFAANLQSPPRLEGSVVLGVAGGCLAAMAAWLMILWRRFARLPG